MISTCIGHDGSNILGVFGIDEVDLGELAKGSEIRSQRFLTEGTDEQSVVIDIAEQGQ